MSNQSPRIHLIERADRMQRIERPSTYESGYWSVTQATAEKLVGGDIYFHTAQTKPAHFGGRITAYRIVEHGEWQDRVVFTFIADPLRCRGFIERSGWGTGSEKNIFV